MTQAVIPNRARKCIFLVVLLLAAGAPMTQVGASAASCRASINTISAGPMYADPGQTVKVRVTLRDEIFPPDNELSTSRVRIKVSATYADGSEALAPTWVGPLNVHQVFERDIAIPASVPEAASGRGTIKVELPADGPPTDPVELVNWCTLGDVREMTWGFYLRQKPDLQVVEGSVKLMRHFDGDENLLQTYHAEPMRANERFVRYPTVVAGNGVNTCLEETGDTNPGSNSGFVSRGHLEFTVSNAGPANFRANATTGGELPLTFRVVDRTTTPAQVIGTPQTRMVAINGGGQLVIAVNSGINFSLVDRPGLRNIAIEVDSNRLYAETDEANNVLVTPAEKTQPGAIYFQAPDLLPGAKNVRLTSDGKAAGTYYMENIGERTAGDPTEGEANNICHSRTGTHPTVRVYLDRIDPANEIEHLNATLGPAGSQDPSNRTGDEDFESKNRIGAGEHKIIIVADARVNVTIADAIAELNETNNVLEIPLLIEDLVAPVLSNLRAPATGRTGQAINISGRVTDDANFTLDANKVWVNITYPNGTLFQYFVPKTLSLGGGFYQNSSDEKDVEFYLNASYPLEGVYSYVIHAHDTIHEAVSAVRQFTLTDYSKDMSLVSLDVCRGTQLGVVEPGTCVDYDGNSTHPANVTFLNETSQFNQVVRVRFHVPLGATGLDNELNNSARKTVEVRDRDGVMLGNFTVTPICYNRVLANISGQDPWQDGSACSDARPDCVLNITCWRSTFQVLFGRGLDLNSTVGTPQAPFCQPSEQTLDTNLTKPAQWNLTIWVGDAGCKFRGHSPDLQAKPVTLRFGLWDTVSATVTEASIVGGTTVQAGNDVRFRLRAEDNLTVLRTFVRVLRETGGVAQQVMLEDLRPTGDVNPVNGTGHYQADFDTGIYTPLDQEGTYQWLLGALDANNTISWNSANGTTCTPDWAPPNGASCLPTPRTFTLDDTRRPTVSGEAMHLVDPDDGTVDEDPVQGGGLEFGSIFVLQALATDDTRINVTAEIQNNAGGAVRTLPMTRVAGDRYRSGNVTVGPGADLGEGEYRFIVRVRDSANNLQESALQQFRVASNLPPTFSQRTPADDGFGPPNGTVGVDIQDAQGIVTSSVQAVFGINTDTPATPASNLVVAAPPGGPAVPTQLRASFQLPATVKHGDKVVVRMTATDASNPPLPGNTTWNFTIDGVAPRSTLTCTRAHPASCGAEGPQAVRGDTEFTLAATDADSGVVGLRYAVDVAGTPGPTQSVTGTNATFRLGSFAAQDGFYILRFRAVDGAGNEEPERRLTFALDTSGPGIQNVLATPTASGWNLTATISDTHSDVRAATLHYRTGASPFSPVPLTQLPDTTFWFGNLPGARRGQQVCYYLEATDFLDNVATNGTSAAPVCFNSENHPPSLVVQAPRDGQAVVGALTVQWTVSDLDADPFTVTLGYRLRGEVAFIPIPLNTEEQGQRTKIFDTSGLAAGEYQLRVQAADNQPFNNVTTVLVGFSIGGAGAESGVPRLDRVSIAPGEPVRVRVTIPRPASNVEAVLLRGTQVVQTVEMEQDPPGSTTWVAEFRVAEPGVYQVEVRGEYTDGEPFVLRAASQLTVQPSDPLGLAGTVLMVALAAAVVVMAALGLRRRGWL